MTKINMKFIDKTERGETFKGNMLAVKSLRIITGLSLKNAVLDVKEMIDQSKTLEFTLLKGIDPATDIQIATLHNLGFVAAFDDVLGDYIELAQPLMNRAMADRQMTVLAKIAESLLAVSLTIKN